MRILTPPMCNPHRLRQAPQTQHRHYPEKRPGRENYKRITPPNEVHHSGNELNRNRRQEKAKAHLNCECSADVLRIAELSDTRGKLCGVRYDTCSPYGSDEQEEKWVSSIQ